MGDHVRLVMLEAIVKEMQQKNLLKLVRESGDILLGGLKELEVRVGAQGKQLFRVTSKLKSPMTLLHVIINFSNKIQSPVSVILN